MDIKISRDLVLALVLAFLAFSGLQQGEPGALLLLLGLGALYLSRRDRPRDDDYAADPVILRKHRPVNVEQIHEHALDAVRRAGGNPDILPVLPVDMGLLSFHGDDDPVIHRTWPVDDDADYVQPFVQLRLPVAASGRIMFEILDDLGKRVYIHEDQYHLVRGRNLIMPSTRLPVHDEQHLEGRWDLRVLTDGVLLASHAFTWAATENPDFRRHIGEDGEISSEMRAILHDSRLQRLSLDELLLDQHEEQDQTGRRAQ